jgi:AraC-like DNA-binding protein
MGLAAVGIENKEVARRQGVTPRNVQILLEQQGTTFGGFVIERRLDAARVMLGSPRYAETSIAGIAFEAAFRDLSHFSTDVSEDASASTRATCGDALSGTLERGDSRRGWTTNASSSSGTRMDTLA